METAHGRNWLRATAPPVWGVLFPDAVELVDERDRSRGPLGDSREVLIGTRRPRHGLEALGQPRYVAVEGVGKLGDALAVHLREAARERRGAVGCGGERARELRSAALEGV